MKRVADPQVEQQPGGRLYRPGDLARPHGLSSQAIRNYEDQGIIPPALRLPSGHRRYRELHRVALDAFVALVPALGHAASAELVRLGHRGQADRFLQALEDAYAQLARDRATLDLVAAAIDGLVAEEADGPRTPVTIGALAHQLRIRPATLRAWERAGIVTPQRDPRTGYRRYQPDDVRDARLAGQLRRGGYPLLRIAAVLAELRQHGDRARLEQALADWRTALRRRGRALLRGSALLSDLLDQHH